MKIEKSRVVSLSYTLIVDGDTIETVTADSPLQFIFGTGSLLPKFEENLNGKIIGDKFDFKLSATEGYGEINPDAIVELSKEMFKINGKIEEGLLTVGKLLPMQDSDGNRLQGSVEEVKEDIVVMNFNHPLAGEELHFQGEVVEIREATPKELLAGLNGELVDNCSSGSCAGCSGC